MAWWYGMNLTCPGNVTLLFLCANGHCINNTLVCDRINHCGDNSDEDFSHAHCYEAFPFSGTVVAGIVIGTVVGIAILCCVVGTVVDCFVHIYKYWCSCLNKAYRYQTEMVALRTPRHSPSDPSVVVVRALPPSYSTIVTSPTDPASVPMLSSEQQNPPSSSSQQRPSSGKDAKQKKKDLMMRMSRVAIRDCIPDIETDSDDEDEEERAVRNRLNQNRPKDLVIMNKNPLLAMEFAEDSNARLSNKREYGVDTQDLQYYQRNLSYLRENSIGTSTRDLSRFANEGVIPKEPKKILMVSRDIQTDDVVTCVVPDHMITQSDHVTNQCEMKITKDNKEVHNSEKSSLCTPMLPPSYSSIFQNGGNLIHLSSEVSCNGYVELPPKEKTKDPPH